MHNNNNNEGCLKGIIDTIKSNLSKEEEIKYASDVFCYKMDYQWMPFFGLPTQFHRRYYLPCCQVACYFIKLKPSVARYILCSPTCIDSSYNKIPFNSFFFVFCCC